MKTTMSKTAIWGAALLALGFASMSGAESVAEVTIAGQKQMLTEPGTPILGSAHPNITVVEYFDYNCSYCRKLAPAFGELVGKDSKVAVLYKEWPIFGGVSAYAAKAALAAQWQGKYLQAHDALIGGPRLSEDAQVDATLQRAGIDMARLKADLGAHGLEINQLLDRNRIEATALNLPGTPGMVVGRFVVPGIGDLQTLETAVEIARKSH
jgi:protein-disulfide isomerase